MIEAGLPQTLKGIAIGNGWIDARRQYPAYLEYGLKHGLVESGSDVRKPSLYLIGGADTFVPALQKGQIRD